MKIIFKALLSIIFALGVLASAETLTIRSEDGFTLKGWLELPAQAKRPVPLALLVHEFAADHTMWKELADSLHEKGYATFAVDLRGHGASTDKSGKKVIVTLKDFGKARPDVAFEKIPSDLLKWMELLEKRKELDLESPLFIGSSLGGGALVPLMLDYEPRAVLTLSPAAPGKAYAEEAAEAVENSDAPWMIVSSQKDFALGATLDYGKKALRPTLLILPGSGHGSKLLPAARGYIRLFLDRYAKASEE
ncbi:alpha/beta hydrolase [Nitratifractor sp.]